jgi:hypothetical protein
MGQGMPQSGSPDRRKLGSLLQIGGKRASDADSGKVYALVS